MRFEQKLSFYSILCIFILFVSSCTNSDDETSEEDSTADLMNAGEPGLDKEHLFDQLIWKVDYDTTRNDFVLVKNREINTDTLQPTSIIQEINSVWPEATLQLKKISHDTIFVSIPDSHQLTEKNGSSGVDNYIASTTYNLTELKGIDYVNYSFEQGSYVSPGTLKRDDFKDYQ